MGAQGVQLIPSPEEVMQILKSDPHVEEVLM